MFLVYIHYAKYEFKLTGNKGSGLGKGSAAWIAAISAGFAIC
jgi:hypothetical protein